MFMLTSLLSLHEQGTAAGALSISALVEEDFSLPCSHQEILGKVLVPWVVPCPGWIVHHGQWPVVETVAVL